MEAESDADSLPDHAVDKPIVEYKPSQLITKERTAVDSTENKARRLTHVYKNSSVIATYRAKL